MNRNWPRIYLALAAFVLPATVPASQLVYLAEQDFTYVVELYVVDLDRPGETLKLNRPLSSKSGGVASFVLSPDGRHIAFIADQDTRWDSDLYLLDLAALGSWTRVGSVEAGAQESFARFSPDGNKLAFTATDMNYGSAQLYLTDLATPSVSVRLNPALLSNGFVSLAGFEFTPDGRHLVYGAAQERNAVDLYLVEIANPGQAVRLNPLGGGVGDTYEARFEITPDGSRVIYSAVGDTPGMRELHAVSLAAPGIATTLNAPLQPEGDVQAFTLSPDGRFVVYAADQETDFVNESYLVELAVPGVATKINRPVQYSARLARFTPDSKQLMYFADEERGLFEDDLYMVSVEDPAQRVRLNAPLGPGESVVDNYSISPDGGRVSYTPQADDAYKTELMLVELAAPGNAVRVNGPMPDSALEFGSFGRQDFSPDGKEIVFLTYHRDTSAHRLYFARPSEPGTSIAIGKPLPKDGMFSPVPDYFQFLPADAPKITPAPPPPAGSPPASGAGGGGGSIGLATLLLLLACLRPRRAKHWRISLTDSARHS
jgi:Tol biopolymer transport system component